jgi:hypothetical protein
VIIGKEFSQESTKVSIPDIYLIPIQVNKAGEGQGVSNSMTWLPKLAGS